MINLLEETIEILNYHNKELSDIIFISHHPVHIRHPKDCNCKVDEETLKTILNFEYDDGYGSTEVNMGLKLVGKDFWLERHEYDGSEWWEYKALPIYNEDFACDISEIPIED